LSKTYSTELKQKVFTNTEEYISLNNELTSFSDMAKKSTYYYLHEDISELFGKSYDLKTQSFHCTLLPKEPYIPGYLYFLDIWLSYPAKYTVNGKNMLDMDIQQVHIPVLDENIALEIENNIKDCAILFIFNIEKTKDVSKERSNKRSLGYILAGKWCILGKTKSVHIVNTKSGKVYVKVPL
jgi:hypothetical protein